MDEAKFSWLIAILLCMMLLANGCVATEPATPAAPAQLVSTAPPASPPTNEPAAPPTSIPTSIQLPPTDLPTKPPPTATTEPTQAEPAAQFSLAEPGPYFVGNTSLKLTDTSRGDREIRLTIFYPALEQKDADGRVIKRNAAPDMSQAHYPVILTGPNTGDMMFLTHLSSHGFVTVIVRFPDFDYGEPWNFGIVDRPMDMLFALDQLATNLPAELAGVMDTNNVGVAGYSWDGFFSLALSGVRIDPEFYLSWCQDAPTRQPAYEDWYLEYTCGLAGQWDEFATHDGEQYTAGDDGLWQPITDERIRAVMPMATDGAWLYGERGLAAVTMPVLMIQATEDSDYQPAEAAFIFEHLGSTDKSMISFIGQDHMMAMQPEQINQMNHFAVAFFSYHLLGQADYLEYFSEDFVNQFQELAWGIYTK